MCKKNLKEVLKAFPRDALQKIPEKKTPEPFEKFLEELQNKLSGGVLIYTFEKLDLSNQFSK